MRARLGKSPWWYLFLMHIVCGLVGHRMGAWKDLEHGEARVSCSGIDGVVRSRRHAAEWRERFCARCDQHVDRSILLKEELNNEM